MSILGQLMKDRATWAANRDREFKEEKLKALRRSRTGLACAAIVLVVAVLVVFNYNFIITGLSKFIVAI